MDKKLKMLESKLQALARVESVEKVDLLNELAWEIGYSDLGRAFHVNQEAWDLAQKLSYDVGVARSKRNVGFYYYTQANFDLALRYAYEALDTFEQVKDSEEQANVQGIIGLIYWSLGNFDLTLDYLNRSEQIFQKTKNQERLPWTLTSLGGVHENLGDYEKALAYHKRGLELFRKKENKLGEARALSGIGTVYERRKEFEKALEFHRRSLKIYQGVGSKNGESRAYNDIGSVYQSLGSLEEALKYHRKSLQLRQKIGNKSAEVTSLLNLGRLFNQTARSAKALEVLRKARKYAEEISANPKLYQAHQALSEAYEMRGDLEAALAHLKAYQKIREEVFSDEANIKLKNLQIQFEVEKSAKEAEIHRLKNIELKQALNRLEQANRNLKETQVQLVQSEKMAALGHLTAGIAHEINTPIGAIKSSADISIRVLKRVQQALADSQAPNDIQSKSAFQKTVVVLEKNSDVIMYAVDRIAKIVNSLRNFARVDEAEFKLANLHEGIESTLTLIHHEISDNIRIKKDFGRIPKFRHYPNQLNQVFMTVLRNAVQAIEKEGRITIKTRADNENVYVTISDTGNGMPPEAVNALFDLSFTTKRSRIGIGMGLYNAYNIIQKHKGTIQVESEVGKGTTFLITLPRL